MSRSIIRTLACLALALASSLAFADPHGSECWPRPEVFLPEARPYGLSYEQWAVRYLQWSVAFPATANPAADNAPAEAGQTRGVWILPSVTGNRTVTRSVTVPAHTPLLVAALSLRVNNTECPTDTEYTLDELFERVRAQWEVARETHVTIDGVEVAELDDPQTSPYLVEAGPFPITLADHDNQLAAGGLSCVPDEVTLEPNVARGVFLMVRPLSLGSHTIQIRAVAGPPEAPVFVKDVTYQIDVVRR
jgi:hypothetical protein